MARTAARAAPTVSWRRHGARAAGAVPAGAGAALIVALATYHAGDPSFDAAGAGPPSNLLGEVGANAADAIMQLLGLGGWAAALLLLLCGVARLRGRATGGAVVASALRLACGLLAVVLAAAALAAAPAPRVWPLAAGLGGATGDFVIRFASDLADRLGAGHPDVVAAGVLAFAGLVLASVALGWSPSLPSLRLPAWPRRSAAADDVEVDFQPIPESASAKRAAWRAETPAPDADFEEPPFDIDPQSDAAPAGVSGIEGPLAIKPPKAPVRTSQREARESQPTLDFGEAGAFRLPELAMLAKPKARASAYDEEALRQNARLLEGVLSEFGVRGQIDNIRPGPVVTLYELVPAPGVKSARVVALSDDIARSMSVAACRVAVVPGRNAIGIELPNARRETVYLRDLLSSAEYEKAGQALPLALGETIGGEPYIVDLARMPHLLIAGTTGSGKSVGVNAMILSILYRLPPERCRFIMIDPKMLELSVYDGIPHLLAPVVTDPKKAIVALKWTVREMEDRYRRMSKIGVRNVAGYNDKANEALAKGEHFVRTVQTGFDQQGRPIFEEEKLRPEPMPYLVVVIDEVADLMLVAGKDIEGAVQRLAQMARAAGIHLIMATQRPSVDVITGTIKANFPTRISFQVTSKIDSRTIMGEQGAEQLLGLGDMLYMAGGGRITRLHGPFVSDEEVETVAKYLRDQGEPDYLEDVTAVPEEDDDAPGLFGDDGGGSNDLYDQAVAVVTRDRKASTSYIQRRLQIGYNRAASLIERMEREGVVSAANHAGKREILAGPPPPA
ncbi:MAG: DNA translocase FtsK 4TM domain-containing protein [Caulobacteraceae bacterium]|nr:DNA translocase FtsK 4TM domain-containing protein [Caulobacteraceae bacterium]